MSEPKPCVLVADDDPDARRILFDSLTYWGAEVLTAANGEEALHLAAARPIDVALVDVVMPEPAGMELAACLRRIDPHTSVIIITGFGSTEQAVEMMKEGACYYLQKPCRPKRVRKVVEQVWQEQRARSTTITSRCERGRPTGRSSHNSRSTRSTDH